MAFLSGPVRFMVLMRIPHSLENRDYERSLQIYKDDPIHRVAAELRRADNSGRDSGRGGGGGGGLIGALFHHPRRPNRPNRRPRRSVGAGEEYFSPIALSSSNSWKQRSRKQQTSKRSYKNHQGGRRFPIMSLGDGCSRAFCSLGC